MSFRALEIIAESIMVAIMAMLIYDILLTISNLTKLPTTGEKLFLVFYALMFISISVEVLSDILQKLKLIFCGFVCVKVTQSVQMFVECLAKVLLIYNKISQCLVQLRPNFKQLIGPSPTKKEIGKAYINNKE